jgi:hypothetical protein
LLLVAGAAAAVLLTKELLLPLPQAKHPCILQHFDAFLERVNGKRVAVFLDYDGTCCVGQPTAEETHPTALLT